MNVSSTLAQPVLRGWHAILARAGSAYLSGAGVPDAVHAAETWFMDGYLATLCYWQAENDRAAKVATTTQALVEAAGARSPWCDVALKVPAMGFDPGLLRDIVDHARERDVRLWFDSHGLETATRTLDLAEVAAARGCAVGVAVPARWSRSRDDVVRAREAGLAVRLVKGQWKDPSWTGGDVGEAMLALVDRLADHRGCVAVASHDVELVRAAMERRRACGGELEIQLLDALPGSPVIALADKLAVPLRAYVPFGHPSLVYSLRNVWENRRVAWWFARDAVTGRSSARAVGRPRYAVR